MPELQELVARGEFDQLAEAVDALVAKGISLETAHAYLSWRSVFVNAAIAQVAANVTATGGTQAVRASKKRPRTKKGS